MSPNVVWIIHFVVTITVATGRVMLCRSSREMFIDPAPTRNLSGVPSQLADQGVVQTIFRNPVLPLKQPLGVSEVDSTSGSQSHQGVV